VFFGKVVILIIINTFVLLKRIFYILLFIGFSFSGFSQTKSSSFATNDVTKSVKLYPNPAVSFINFEFSKKYDPSYTIVIFSFIGKKVEEIKVSDQKMTISLNNYYRGVYIFQLRDSMGNIIESGKFQVVK